MVYNGKIPTDRVIDKLDDYLSKKDFDGAKRHLNYWLTESRALSDGNGEILILNELISISLNSISKWRARDLPSFKDYYEKYGKIPTNLTIGFSYLMAIYSSVYNKDGKYLVDLPTRTVEIKDDIPYLEYFAKCNSIEEFMKDVNVWGEDLTKYKDFLFKVISNVNEIKGGNNLI